MNNLNKRRCPPRGWLPSRPVPLREVLQKDEESTKAKEGNGFGLSSGFPLDTERLIGMTRIGQASLSPDGNLAVFGVKKYDFDEKKMDEQLWLADLNQMADSRDSELRSSVTHLRQLTSGSQHGWTSANSPNFSPCGNFIAFLSNRNNHKKTCVWILPVRGPGEATLLKEFPVSVGDLDWSHEAKGIIVSASVYADGTSKDHINENLYYDTMETTAARDKVLEDPEGKLGGLNAVLFKRLPMREWDRWIDAKMVHPFFVPVTSTVNNSDLNAVAGYRADDTRPVDLLQGVPTAVPCGAFGGSEDWSVSKNGAIAISARPPLAPDEAWTTNRHIYLMKNISSKTSEEVTGENFEELLGECITKGNPGYDTNPVFSPDGKRLAWLTMKSPTYESDAVGILVYDLETQVTSTLLEAETDWDYSPNSLTWSEDGKTLFFTADVRSRQALCSIDSTLGAKQPNGGIRILKGDQSTFLHGEVANSGSRAGHLLLASVQSLTMPTELFVIDSRGDETGLRQVTHFNTQRVADTKLGQVKEFTYRGEKGDDVQSWLIYPAGFTQTEGLSESTPTDPLQKHPLVVIYHGGPQGSSADDWHYRWNLQYFASMGFAVLAPNFHGSTGFGHEFCRDITGNWEIGGRDTIHGVRAVLTEHSWIDPRRVVGLGGSYGGYTSNWLNGNAPEGMFQALVCHCGTFGMRSSYYATDELFFKETECGGAPHTDQHRTSPTSQWNKVSPSNNVHQWKTPTLVIHGAKDYRLVESEGISTFTALQRRGVPSEFLYLPTENHHCLNPQNSMVWHETILRWIRKWTTPGEETDIVPPRPD
eukprot:CAMPEP_0194400124 /NCGR_PEP_ID=MMETSP0174-20130528/127035_1 /TAXON_ID=216777 /ORGANISM="Proboscia alata, Strain PI-D3" /LENGTH=817 /DNA_ID=CAMNT_0039196597 /DNA_START=77 /DNA_END=2530 /DNA_ORIENTATION=+